MSERRPGSAESGPRAQSLSNSHSELRADDTPPDPARGEWASPFGLWRDILYLWGVFRLRYRPTKMIGLLVLLGLGAAVWQVIGAVVTEVWYSSRGYTAGHGLTQLVLERTVQAIFSSLNFLSCVTIVIMGRSLRRLMREGHLEALLMVPRRVRPSAIFYAISIRYLPLAPIAVLVIYIDPTPVVGDLLSNFFNLHLPAMFSRSPFSMEPFAYHSMMVVPPDLKPLYWSGAHQISVLLFCSINLFMDLALAFWWMNRWKASWPTILMAVALIGIVSPVLLVTSYEVIDEWVRQQVIQRDSLLRSWASGEGGYFAQSTLRDMTATIRYASISLFSLILGWIALVTLDRRWARVLASTDQDPVMLRPVE